MQEPDTYWFQRCDRCKTFKIHGEFFDAYLENDDGFLIVCGKCLVVLISEFCRRCLPSKPDGLITSTVRNAKRV